jgi:starvation-inducible DNA-binding protein
MCAVLSDSFTLYVTTHGFHWNVEGPMFNTLHQMFMDQYTELWAALDLIAERIRALGAPAPASYQSFSKYGTIDEAPAELDAMGMVRHLLVANEALVRTIRTALERAENGRDVSTADLLTGRLQVHEKSAWMLRSLLK